MIMIITALINDNDSMHNDDDKNRNDRVIITPASITTCSDNITNDIDNGIGG